MGWLIQPPRLIDSMPLIVYSQEMRGEARVQNLGAVWKGHEKFGHLGSQVAPHFGTKTITMGSKKNTETSPPG